MTWLCVAGPTALAAELDPARLPPPATNQIDFKRDVAPIFENLCFRCHGEEKAKSNFSLASRERALKGGSGGVDILPGNSAESPLIHYVARQVEDMEMPPMGKGDPLTDEQVGILRAWIDQGARWDTQPDVQVEGSLTPSLSFIHVDGDRGAFRELEGRHEDWSGGLEAFAISVRHTSGSRSTLEGRALAPHDYAVRLEQSKPGLGFILAGAETWRRYYDDVGGYNPLATPSIYRLDEDLALDIGRAWFEMGLTLPEAPTVALGYEYRFRDGEKSTLQWGLADGRAVYPASKTIDEQLHRLELELQYAFKGWQLEDHASIEWYRNRTLRNNTLRQRPPPVRRVEISQDNQHVSGANTLRVEKEVADGCLFSAAYFYSQLSGTSDYSQTTVDGNGAPASGTFWSAQRIELDSCSHVFSFSGAFQPLDTVSASLGVQNEYLRQSGFGPVHLDSGDPTNPFLFPVNVDSSLDRQRLSELAALRFTGIPFTVLFADVRFDQENGSQFEQEIGNLPAPLLLRDTDYRTRRGDGRVGVQISQWRFASVTVHYRWRHNDNDYDHVQDLAAGPGAGYSAHIRERDLQGTEFQTSITLRPSAQLRARFDYRRTDTQYNVDTDPVPFLGLAGGDIDAGVTRANRYTLSVTFKPWRRLALGASLGYTDSTTRTADNDAGAVADYAGQDWWARGTVRIVVSARDDLFASYEYWDSQYGQTHFTTGLPLGSDYARHAAQVGLSRRWNEHLTSAIRYGFYQYDDAASGGARDYSAHGVFATVSYEWN